MAHAPIAQMCSYSVFRVFYKRAHVWQCQHSLHARMLKTLGGEWSVVIIKSIFMACRRDQLALRL